MQNPDIGAYVQRGRQAMMERRFDDAREIYQQILALDPAQPRAWLALSALAQSQGDFRESVRAVRSAVSAWRRSGSQQFITELSMRLLVFGDYEQARDIIVSADWSDPVVLRYSMGLVQYLGLTEAHREALDLADHALSRIANPPSSLLFARANALRYLGRIQDATEAYERCLAMDPLHAEAHWALAHHQRSDIPGARVARIRKAAAYTNSSSDEAIYFQYALFKELEDARQYEDAWSALQHGAKLKRGRLNYDRKRWDDSFVSLKLEFRSSDSERHAVQERPTGASHIPIFIVGLPRSGTTLLERMIGRHPDVGSAGELLDFPMQLSWESNRFLGGIIRNTDVEALRAADYRDLGNSYLARTSWRVREGKRFLIDKLPDNFINTGFIGRALPEAKVICMVRDRVDSCFSVFKHLFSGASYPFSYDFSEMEAHYERFIDLENHWAQVMPDSFLPVRYEQLVAAPEETMRRISDFCGLAYDASMLSNELNAAPSATASSSQIRAALHGGYIGKWQPYAEWLRPEKYV